MPLAGFDSIGQAAMRRHSIANLLPTHIHALLLQTASNIMPQVVSKQGDEYMGITSLFFLMKNRAQQ
jgi:hypothetical protein